MRLTFLYLLSKLLICEGVIFDDPSQSILRFAKPHKSLFSLVNKNVINDHLIHNDLWASSHDAQKNYLGAGMLYYSIAYALKSKTCVCIGSGEGFVPRIMRQAQRDLELENSITVLIDGNIGNYGRPSWINIEDHFLLNEYPDIEIIVLKSEQAAIFYKDKLKIDYLHIDGDHSYEGCLQDALNFIPLMNQGGVITFHDTAFPSISKVLEKLRKKGFNIVNLSTFGNGVGILYME